MGLRIVVLGMHSSGTWAAARVVNLLGATGARSCTLAARSVLVRPLPLGSRRRAACDARLGTLAVMRRIR